MKTALAAITFASLCSALLAQPLPQSAPVVATRTAPAVAARKSLPAQAAPRVMDPAARSNMLAKTGGIILSPAEGPTILFLDTQKRVPSQALRSAADQFQKVLRLPIIFTAKPSSEPVTEAVKALADKNTAVVVVIGDSAGYPALLVAPESRWALVNVAALSSDGANAETVSERTHKEVCRAFGYVMGAANSNFEQCLMKPVFSVADLDALKAHSLSPEPFNKIMAHAQKLGILTSHMTTYRKAVEEGWAPAPTNDLQSAIWQELKK